jgi:hypothetical protein
MSRDTGSKDRADNGPSVARDRKKRRGFDRQLLFDLSVNVVPIGIIAVFTLFFVVLSPTGGVGDSVLLFHGALIGGVVLVSVIAGWVIKKMDSPLEGSAARSYDTESDHD